jgi:hypothetical protein
MAAPIRGFAPTIATIVDPANHLPTLKAKCSVSVGEVERDRRTSHRGQMAFKLRGAPVSLLDSATLMKSG